MTQSARVWSDPLHSDYRTHTDHTNHNNYKDNNNHNNNNNKINIPVSRVIIRNEGILRQPLSMSLPQPLHEPLSLCDTVFSPPWAPIVIFMPSQQSSSSSSSHTTTPVFAEPFALLDMINKGLSTDGDILVMTLEAGPEHGLETGQKLVSKVVIASPGASMTVLKETLLATQGFILGPNQTQEPGLGEGQGLGLHEDLNQEEKRVHVDGSAREQGLGFGPDGRVTKASLPAHQWRSVCVMLQLRQRHTSYAWDEGEALVPGKTTHD